MHVSGSAAAGHEEGIGRRRGERSEGGWAGGVGSSGRGLGINAGYVAGAATAGVVDVGSGDGRVGFGDVVLWGHFGGLVGCDVVWWWWLLG
jgi:hypothetical protein